MVNKFNNLLKLQGHVGESTVEELELSINNCKLMILEADEHSSARRSLVKKLVELRLKLSEAKVSGHYMICA